jgi:hypothetical protein
VSNGLLSRGLSVLFSPPLVAVTEEDVGVLREIERFYDTHIEEVLVSRALLLFSPHLTARVADACKHSGFDLTSRANWLRARIKSQKNKKCCRVFVPDLDQQASAGVDWAKEGTTTPRVWPAIASLRGLLWTGLDSLAPPDLLW